MTQINRRKIRRVAADHRLDRSTWIESALQVLAARGINGVRIEVLAKALGVTKGSFYWHFRDRVTLLTAMLQEWRRRATLPLIERLEATGETPLTRLRRLLRSQFDAHGEATTSDMELAVRLWARQEARPAEVIREIDELRLRHIEHLLTEIGVTQQGSRGRAVLIYCYIRELRSLVDPARESALTRLCEDILIGTQTTK
jgi:AcrR family transcriptional regulator